MQLQWELAINSQLVGEVSWDHVRESLSQLNGEDTNMVSITSSDKGSLYAGGGNHGRYLIMYMPDDTKDTPSLTLTDLSNTGLDVELVVQTVSNYPAKWCVELPLVIKVFDQFFHTGTLPKDVRWERDSSEEEAAREDIP